MAIICNHNNPNQVANGRTVLLNAAGPLDVNQLFMFSGIASANAGGESSIDLQILMPMPQGVGQPSSGVGPTAFAAIASENTANDSCELA